MFVYNYKKNEVQLWVGYNPKEEEEEGIVKYLYRNARANFQLFH